MKRQELLHRFFSRRFRQKRSTLVAEYAKQWSRSFKKLGWTTHAFDGKKLIADDTLSHLRQRLFVQ